MELRPANFDTEDLHRASRRAASGERRAASGERATAAPLELKELNKLAMRSPHRERASVRFIRRQGYLVAGVR
jgi:hypothetical protein